MTETSRTLPPGGSRKRARSEAELAEAAARFAGSWVAGDSVQTWLNWHEGRLGELSELLFRGWSWADIGLALFRAGICYGTGRPIPASTLQVKASQARSKARRQRAAEARQPARSAEPPPIEPPPIETAPIAAAPASPAPPSRPAAPVVPPPAAGSVRQRARRTPQEVDALIARLLGKTPADRRAVAAELPPPSPAPASDARRTLPAADRAAPTAPAEPDARGSGQPKPAPDAAGYWRGLAKGRLDRG